MSRKGYHPFIVEGAVPGRGTWYRVRMGRFDNEDAATAAKHFLARADIGGWVLRAE